MFDKFKPFQILVKQSFTFQPERYEIWMNQKMIDSGITNSILIAKVINRGDFDEKVEILFEDSNLIDELSLINTFDLFITSDDRLRLIIIPEETNGLDNPGIIMLKMTLGTTRSSKFFKRNEPYCCNMFLKDGKIAKVTFSYSNPEKLLEFYQ